MRAISLVAVVALLIAANSGRAQSPVSLLATPAGPESGMYSLTTGADGETYLAWLEPTAGNAHALKFSRFDGRGWQAPIQIAEGSDWFVNWADRPSLTAARDGRLFVHWLVYTGRKTGAYGYAIRVQSSADRGRSWRTVFEEGLRNVSDYSGFLSFLPGGDQMSALYLTPLSPDDGAAGHEGGHVKTVGVARFGADGREIDRTIVDADACSCCSTDTARTSLGPIGVYRDHEAGEIRDIAIVRHVNGRWTSPASVHRDGWIINGCPTNGPAVAAAGTAVAVAWFTAANGQPKVNVAFSADAGATFSAPLRVDDGNPVGWADVAMLGDGRTIVSWLERADGGKGWVRVREMSPSGRQEAHTVAAASAGRTTGIPMMVPLTDDDLLLAWRDGRVRTARVTLPGAARSTTR